MNATLLPVENMKNFNKPTPWIQRVKGGSGDIWSSNAHEQDWIRAAKESPAIRKQSSSHFGFSGPFNEMVVMGMLAVRLQGLNRELLWDGINMNFTNISPNDEISVVSVDEFDVIDGDPKFNRQYVKINALEAAKSWIKPEYKNGFSLPEMPK